MGMPQADHQHVPRAPTICHYRAYAIYVRPGSCEFVVSTSRAGSTVRHLVARDMERRVAGELCRATWIPSSTPPPFTDRHLVERIGMLWALPTVSACSLSESAQTTPR